MRFLGHLAAGDLIAEPVAASDWLRIAELVAHYADLPIGTVDASVIAAAERLGRCGPASNKWVRPHFCCATARNHASTTRREVSEIGTSVLGWVLHIAQD